MQTVVRHEVFSSSESHRRRVMKERDCALLDTPVGPLLARVDAGKLTELSFFREGRSASLDVEDETLSAVKVQLGEYFDGKRQRFDVPLLLQGPAFYRRVWEALLDIPYGATISYGELAKNVGEPDAARAVGAANGANPIAIIVPCHRVIGAGGDLVGYGGGLERKRTLLELESGRLRLL